MLDAPQMFPKGFHAQRRSVLPDFSDIVRARRRKFTRGIKYRFVDFEGSCAFESREARTGVRFWSCKWCVVPEIQICERRDPFKVDVYALGSVFEEELIAVLHCPPAELRSP